MIRRGFVCYSIFCGGLLRSSTTFEAFICLWADDRLIYLKGGAGGAAGRRQILLEVPK